MKKIAAVTGAASGIGLDIALTLKEKGYHTFCLDIKQPDEDLGLHYIHCDVSDEEKVQSVFQEIEKEGDCELLVNNSGLQFMSPVEEFPIEKWNQLISVMLTGTFLCSKAVIPQMKKHKAGRIINISSIHGKDASPYKAAYVAAKHGILGLAKVIAKEVAENNITVNTICPGFVDTPLMRQQVQSQMELNNLSEEQVLRDVFLKKQDVKKLTQPSQISEMVLFLASDSASTITGEAYNISGGWGMGL